MKLRTCYALLARDRRTNAVTVVRVYLDRVAADAARNILDWWRDLPAEFSVAESTIEMPEETA